MVSIAPLATPVAAGTAGRRSPPVVCTGLKGAAAPRPEGVTQRDGASIRHSGTIFLTCLITN